MIKLEKQLNRAYKANSGKNPSASGGLLKAANYPVSWIAGALYWSKAKSMQFDAAVEPAVSPKQRKRNAFEDARADCLDRIDELRKLIDKTEKKLSKAKKEKRVLELEDDHSAFVDALDRQLKLLEQIRKNLV